ncbi:MAG: hypothetical protein P4N60_23285 [Verrucomicrobiae bacterium]|nr:hypothetical protein [Verrucomicrobiae bacterium]
MDYSRSHLKLWLCALLLAVAWPVVAQESIVFTKPADLPTDKANDFMGGGDHKAPGGYNAPSLFLNSKPRADFDILPGAPKPRTPSPEEIKLWQKFTDEKKNWTLMTPEQILGIPTAEQIMGLPDPNHEENLTVEEKYLRRQERERNFSATNAMHRPDDFLKPDNNPFLSKNDAKNADQFQQFQQDQRNGGGMLSASRLGAGGSSMLPATDSGRNPDSIWHSAFTVVPEIPKPDPQQVAAMERFKAMMEPPVMEKPVAASGFATPAPVIDHNMQAMPAYNPAGRTFTPLENNIGRPTGLNPLPTVTGQRPLDTLPKPKPLVKPPPWLSDDPQTGKPLQRKF